ncbi:alpha/beta hydrolase [candidate division WOR-3 bacterium]|nr:alpha/beta hydrolase [candidate division WOR-3 bacterium]
MRTIIITIILLLFLWFIVKSFERRNIYFPTRSIDVTPKDIGLKYEDLYITTEDGVEINAWYIPAPSGEITILLCHGNGGNISHRLDIIRIFNTIGYNVLIFDYRGYGRSKGRISEKGTYFDALAAYNYIVEKKEIDAEKICILGRSLGGPIAIDLATRINKGVIISESGFTSIMDMAKVGYGVRIPAKFLSHKYDALTKIKSVNIPILIMHSKNDPMIPFEQGRRLFDAANQPKEFYQGSGSHDDIYLEDEYWKRIGEFVAKYLK